MNYLIKEQKMNEYEVVRPHSFEDAINHIKSFSESTSPVSELNKVDTTDRVFGWFEHRVSGEELNEVIGQIQNYLIELNQLNSDLIKELEQVYKALESLDKEYIPGILCAVKAAEIASDQAKAAQEDINNTIEIQKRTIEAIKRSEDQSFKAINNVSKGIAVLQDFKNELDQQSHIKEIDQIWNNVEKGKSDLNNLSQHVKEIENRIKIYNEKLDILYHSEHILDIDPLWKISKCNEKKIEELQEGTNYSSSSIEELQRQMVVYEANINSLKEKQKVANYLGGSAVFLCIIHFIAHLMGIL